MRKVVISLAVLVLLIFGGLLLVPHLVDLNRFKGPIAAQLSARTGRSIEIAGPIGLSLLPRPTITARDIHLANAPGAAIDDMVRLRAVEVKLSFWPLVLGNIEIRDATLIEPEIDLERSANGEGNWQFQPSASPPAPSTLPKIVIEHLTMQNGAITYRSLGTVERFEHINATVVLDSLAGPFNATGTLVARGAAMSFEARSGKFDASDVPIHAAVTTRPAAQLQLDVTISRGAEDHIDGKVKFRADDLQVVGQTLARVPLPNILARPLALSASLNGSMQDIAFDHLAIDLGEAHGEGTLRIAPGTPRHVDLHLLVNRLDLGRWLATHKAALAPTPVTGTAFAATSDATADIPPQQLAQDGGFILPRDVDIGIEIGIEAMLWRNDLVRDARLKARLADGKLALSELTAQLPGGSDISLSGNGVGTAQGPRGDGIVEANTDNLRGFLAWLGVTMGDIPADRLGKASLSSSFTVAGDRLDLTNIDANLDVTRLGGAATIILRERPGIGVRLAADKLNLDAYVPQPITGGPPVSSDQIDGHPLAAVDANFDAHIDAVTWHGQSLDNVHFAGTLQQDSVTIRDLSVGDANGASATLSGVIDGVSEPAAKGKITLDAQGPELERALRLISPGLATGRSYGAFKLSGGVRSDDGTTFSIDTNLDLLEGHAHLSGDVAPVADKISVSFDTDHPSLLRLLRVVSPSYRPAGGDPGPLKFAGKLTGSAEHFTLDGLSLAIGPSTLEGKLDISLGGARPQILADVKIGDWAIDRLLPARQTAAIGDGLRHAQLLPNVFLAQAGALILASRWSREPFDFGVLTLADVELSLAGHSLAYGDSRIEQPVLTATLKDGVLALKELKGDFSGGSIEASGELASAQIPTLRTTFTLRNTDLAPVMAGVDGRFDIGATLATKGASPLAMISQLGGDVTLKGRDGSIAGIDLKAINKELGAVDHPVDLLSLARGSANARTKFTTLDGTLHVENGVARGDDIRLSADGGAGSAMVSADLPKWTMTSRIEFRLAGMANVPPLVLHIDGPLDEPRKELDVGALERVLSQRSNGQLSQPRQ